MLLHVPKHKGEFNVILKSIMGPCISSASDLLSVNDAVGLGQICRYHIQGHRDASIALCGAESPQHCSSAQAAAKTDFMGCFFCTLPPSPAGSVHDKGYNFSTLSTASEDESAKFTKSSEAR